MKPQKSLPNGGFYWERALYQSDAFLSLSKNGMKLLIALLDARKRATGVAKARKRGKRVIEFTNLHCIEMPYSKLIKTYGMNSEGITKAKAELLAKGFIDITREGGTGQHDKAQYALINDYRHWSPGMVMRERKRDIRRGYQGKRLGATAPKCTNCGAMLREAELEICTCTNCNCVSSDSNKTRTGDLRLIHAGKPEAKS